MAAGCPGSWASPRWSLAFVIGGVLGVIAGFAGGWVNMAIMRTTDVFYAFPSVLLAVAISGALGAGIFNAILSLTPGVHPADHPGRRNASPPACATSTTWSAARASGAGAG